MRSEPDFELLPQGPAGPALRWAVATAAFLATAAVACVTHYGTELGRAKAALEHERTSPPAQHQPVRQAPPAYADAAWAAVGLLQAPVDAWLRETENCLPETARVRELRIDVAATRTTAAIELQGEVALATWLQCLNSGSERPAWRAASVQAATEGGMPAGTWRPNWTVVLERADR